MIQNKKSGKQRNETIKIKQCNKEEGDFTHSQYLKDYLRYFQIQQNQYEHFHDSETNKKSFQKLIKNGFVISQQKAHNIQISNVIYSRNCEVVEMQIKIWNYQTKISILNCNTQSITHSNLHIQRYGAFGNVYFTKFRQVDYAIKCISFNFDQKKIIQILKQYFFALLFSALQIGPKVIKIYGFDLLVCKDCIQFTSQICQDLFQVNQKQLKLLLNEMHSLQLIHRDIKRSNILYSPYYKKNVLIDFGGCEFTQSKLGFSTTTNFYGTVGYCSQQLMGLVNNKSQKVDLYYNDMFGLRKFIHVSSLKQVQYFYEAPQILPLINYQSFLNKMKYLIWKHELEDMQILLNFMHSSFEDQEIQKDFITFLYEGNPSTIQQVYKIYKQNIYNKILYLKDKHTEENIFIKNKFLPSQFQQKSKLFLFQLFYKDIQVQYGPEQQWLKVYKTIQMSEKQLRENVLNLQKIKQMPKKTYQMYLLDFISFSSNNFNFSLEQKKNACLIFTQLYSIPQWTNQIPSLNQELVIFAKVIQFLIRVQIHKIPVQMKQEFYFKCFQSYVLLGYVYGCHEAQLLTINMFNDFELVQRIIFFWKCLAEFLRISSSNILKTKVKLIKNQKGFCQKVKQLLFNLEEQKDTKYKGFLTLNKILYEKLFERGHFFALKQFYQVLKLCPKQNIFQNISNILYFQFRNYILIMVANLSVSNGLQNHAQLICFVQQLYKNRFFKIKINQIPIFLNFLLTLYRNQRNFYQVKNMFQFFDKIVNYTPISYRYSLQFRVALAYNFQDCQFIKKAIQIIQEMSTDQESDFCSISKILVSCQISQYYRRHFDSTKQKQKHIYFQQFIQKVVIKAIQMFYSSIEPSVQKCQQDQLQPKVVNNYCLIIKMGLNFLKRSENLRSFLQKRKNISKDLYFCIKKIPKRYLIYDTIQESYLFFMGYYHKEMLFFLKQLQQIQLLFINKYSDEAFQLKGKADSRLNLFKFSMKLTCELQINNYSPIYYKKFIQFYIELKNDGMISQIFNFSHLIQHIWKAFVYCQTTDDQKLQFIITMTKFILQKDSEQLLFFWNQNIDYVFWSKCKTHYQQQLPLTFNPKALAFHIYEKVRLNRKQSYKSPESILVAYYCLFNPQFQVVKRFNLMMYVIINLNLLKFKPKMIVLQRIYQFFMYFQNSQNRSKWLMNKHLKHMRSMYILDEVIALRIKLQLNRFPKYLLLFHRKKLKKFHLNQENYLTQEQSKMVTIYN